jgi:hypothetical protein
MDINMKKEIHHISIPAVLFMVEGKYYLTPPDNNNMFHCGWVADGDTIEEAERKYLNYAKMTINMYKERSDQLDKYKFFQKGPEGSRWFSILGIFFWLRIRSVDDFPVKMVGGWNVPFTRLNITIKNHWRRKKNSKKD